MGLINDKWLNGYYRKTQGKHDGNNEDFGDHDNNGTNKGYQFEYPTATMVKLSGEDFTTSGGSLVQFFHDKTNNISCRTVHCNNFKTNDLGDDSTGYHIHITYFMGLQTAEYMQENRKNTSVTYTASEINAKIKPASGLKTADLPYVNCPGDTSLWADTKCKKKLATYSNVSYNNQQIVKDGNREFVKIQSNSVGVAYICTVDSNGNKTTNETSNTRKY